MDSRGEVVVQPKAAPDVVVSKELVAGLGVVNGGCCNNTPMLNSSSSSTSGRSNYESLKERDRHPRPQRGRNKVDCYVPRARNNLGNESQHRVQENHGGSVNVQSGFIPRNSGSGHYRQQRPSRQGCRDDEQHWPTDNPRENETSETSKAQRAMRSTTPPQFQQTHYYSGRFQGEKSRGGRNSHGNTRQYATFARTDENYSKAESNRETADLLMPQQGQRSDRDYKHEHRGRQVTSENFVGLHENWRSPLNREGYNGNGQPFTCFRWRRGRGYGRGGQTNITTARDVVSSTSTQKENDQSHSNGTRVEQRIVELPRNEFTTEELHKLRLTEIDLFKKRFPKAKENSQDTFEFTFSPSDPDWPFDVRHLYLKVHFPPKYPSNSLKITLTNPEDILPLTLKEDIDNAIANWIKFFHKAGHLCFRPFLRWLDRNLQDVFVESLRKIKRLQEQHVVGCVDPKPAQQTGITTATDDDTRKKDKEPETQTESIKGEGTLRALPKKHERLLELEENFDAAGCSKPECIAVTSNTPSTATRVSSQGALDNNQLTKILNNYDPQSAPRKGIEIKFRYVDLSESVSFLICDRLLVSVQCKKCKKIADFQLFPGRRSVSSCAKCQMKLEACFRPCILLQFNPVLGYLELDDCTIRDVALPRCHFYADCQGCLKLSPFEGVHMGQRASTNCLTCNIKMQLIVDSIKYMDMCAIDANIKASQVKKANKDSAIQAGKPLPNKGICKHYKKSFRWFRFPCCGKAYPCDDCHNEQESDHTAEFASRMICGFCAKEQPFSNDKPCSQCSNFITGRRTAHWEGGKGCRNKTKMSTNDSKKYRGQNKTVSRKATPAKSK